MGSRTTTSTTTSLDGPIVYSTPAVCRCDARSDHARVGRSRRPSFRARCQSMPARIQSLVLTT